MSSRNLFRRFIKVCERWPKDETKEGRDYAETLRTKYSAIFSHGEDSVIKNHDEVEAQIAALERLVNNSYYNESKLRTSSATGLKAWACKESLTNETLKELHEDSEQTILNRLKTKLMFKYNAGQNKIPD